MRPNYAVQTFKCHKDYDKCAGSWRHVPGGYRHLAVKVLTGSQRYIVYEVQIPEKCCKNHKYKLKYICTYVSVYVYVFVWVCVCVCVFVCVCAFASLFECWIQNITKKTFELKIHHTQHRDHRNIKTDRNRFSISPWYDLCRPESTQYSCQIRWRSWHNSLASLAMSWLDDTIRGQGASSAHINGM